MLKFFAVVCRASRRALETLQWGFIEILYWIQGFRDGFGLRAFGIPGFGLIFEGSGSGVMSGSDISRV